MKQLMFLDLTSVETTVTLPPDYHEGKIASARIVTWNFEGQPEIPISSSQRTDHFYVQIKFEGCLETRALTFGARPDMVQLPLRSFTDWVPTTLTIPLVITKRSWSPFFKVSLWGEGESPAPWAAVPTGVRLLLWLEVDIE